MRTLGDLLEDDSRREAWRSILAGYDLASDGPWAGVVVALGTEYADVAHALARATSRECIEVDSASDVATSVPVAAQCAIVGAPQHLEPRAMDALRALAVPWGVITGHRPSAAAFLAARGLRSRSRRRHHAMLDAISGSWQDAQNPSPVPHVGQIGDGTSRDTLVLLCHGEGGHANLGAQVGCGLVRDVERWLGGDRVVGGCVRGSDTWCRRAGGRTVIHVTELDTELLVLLTCGGFALSGRAFPSDVSLAAAAIEGYPRAFVVADRNIELDVRRAALASTCVRGGMTPSELVVVLNDVEERATGERPFLLIGDPAAAWPCEDAYANDLRRVAVDPAGEAVVELSVDGGPASYLARSTSEVFIRTTARVTAKPCSSRLVAARALLHARELSLAIAVAIETAIGRRHDDVRRMLAGARDHVRTTLDVAAGTVAMIERAGVWNPEVERALGALTDSVAQWDATAASLIAPMLGDGFAQVFSPLFPIEHAEDGTCDRCAASLVTQRGSVGSGVELISCITRCPTCGLRAAWFEGAAKLTAHVELKRRDIRVSLIYSCDPARGHTAVALVDKSTGLVAATTCRNLADGAVEVLHIPSTIGADLHVVHAIVAQDLCVAYSRSRLVCGPRP
ncbi:MAG: hypothetical protein WKG01_32475 [Kofleriaceae bacterium]